MKGKMNWFDFSAAEADGAFQAPRAYQRDDVLQPKENKPRRRNRDKKTDPVIAASSVSPSDFAKPDDPSKSETVSNNNDISESKRNDPIGNSERTDPFAKPEANRVKKEAEPRGDPLSRTKPEQVKTASEPASASSWGNPFSRPPPDPAADASSTTPFSRPQPDQPRKNPLGTDPLSSDNNDQGGKPPETANNGWSWGKRPETDQTRKRPDPLTDTSMPLAKSDQQPKNRSEPVSESKWGNPFSNPKVDKPSEPPTTTSRRPDKQMDGAADQRADPWDDFRRISRSERDKPGLKSKQGTNPDSGPTPSTQPNNNSRSNRPSPDSRPDKPSDPFQANGASKGGSSPIPPPPLGPKRLSNRDRRGSPAPPSPNPARQPNQPDDLSTPPSPPRNRSPSGSVDGDNPQAPVAIPPPPPPRQTKRPSGSGQPGGATPTGSSSEPLKRDDSGPAEPIRANVDNTPAPSSRRRIRPDTPWYSRGSWSQEQTETPSSINNGKSSPEENSSAAIGPGPVPGPTTGSSTPKQGGFFSNLFGGDNDDKPAPDPDKRNTGKDPEPAQSSAAIGSSDNPVNTPSDDSRSSPATPTTPDKRNTDKDPESTQSSAAIGSSDNPVNTPSDDSRSSTATPADRNRPQPIPPSPDTPTAPNDPTAPGPAPPVPVPVPDRSSERQMPTDDTDGGQAPTLSANDGTPIEPETEAGASQDQDKPNQFWNLFGMFGDDDESDQTPSTNTAPDSTPDSSADIPRFERVGQSNEPALTSRRPSVEEVGNSIDDVGEKQSALKPDYRPERDNNGQITGDLNRPPSSQDQDQQRIPTDRPERDNNGQIAGDSNRRPSSQNQDQQRIPTDRPERDINGQIAGDSNRRPSSQNQDQQRIPTDRPERDNNGQIAGDSNRRPSSQNQDQQRIPTDRPERDINGQIAGDSNRRPSSQNQDQQRTPTDRPERDNNGLIAGDSNRRPSSRNQDQQRIPTDRPDNGLIAGAPNRRPSSQDQVQNQQRPETKRLPTDGAISDRPSTSGVKSSPESGAPVSSPVVAPSSRAIPAEEPQMSNNAPTTLYPPGQPTRPSASSQASPAIPTRSSFGKTDQAPVMAMATPTSKDPVEVDDNGTGPVSAGTPTFTQRPSTNDNLRERPSSVTNRPSLSPSTSSPTVPVFSDNALGRVSPSGSTRSSLSSQTTASLSRRSSVGSTVPANTPLSSRIREQANAPATPAANDAIDSWSQPPRPSKSQLKRIARMPRDAHPSRAKLKERRVWLNACPTGGKHELEPAHTTGKAFVFAIVSYPVSWIVPNPFRRCIKCRLVVKHKKHEEEQEV